MGALQGNQLINSRAASLSTFGQGSGLFTMSVRGREREREKEREGGRKAEPFSLSNHY